MTAETVTVEQLFNDLQAKQPAIRQRAAQQLGALRAAQAVVPLIACLRDRSDRVQAAAAEALGRIGDPHAVTALLHSFKGETYGLTDGEGSPSQYFMIVASAAKALGMIGDTPAVEALLKQLRVDNPLSDEGSAAAAVGLGFVRDPRALPALINALRSSSHFVRSQAAEALGRLGDPHAAEALIVALRDRSWTVQLAAATALGDLGNSRAAAPLRATLQQIESFVPESAVDAFMLQDVRMHIHAAAARALARIGDTPSLQLLEQLLQSDRWIAQVAAAVGLAVRKDPRVFETLAKALNDKTTAIAMEAAEGLGHLADQRAEPLLTAASRNRHIPIMVSEVAAQALKQLEATASDSIE